jgi:RimJ/RimL family protein N-acetyltransferase
MVLERSETAASAEPRVRSLDLKSPVLETARLLLRPLHFDDAPDIARLANDYAVASMLASMPHPYFAEDAREFVERKQNVQGDCVYAITLKQSGEFLGICGIHEDLARYELPFVGYWLGQPFWGHGYATEAARAMVDLFFKVTDRQVLMVSARVDNAGSQRVIEKYGARFWKRGTHYNRALGELREVDHYRITRDDWFAQAEGNR